LRERDNKVGVVVVGRQAVSTEVYNFMARCADPGDQVLFQCKPTVIGGNPNTHNVPG
jgi:hypothetical protein